MKTIAFLLFLGIPFIANSPVKEFCFADCIQSIRSNMKTLHQEFFYEALAKVETGDPKDPRYTKGITPYNIVNSIGAMGKWQFMPIALQDIGYTGTTKEFLNSPRIQKNCLIQLIAKNKLYLNRLFPQYVNFLGKKHYGVEITYTGLISACHLAGIHKTIKFLRTGYNASDGGKTVKDYLHIFKDYTC